ncbi:homoserine dehydrogenase [Erysipelotrichaceae bacterium RD49]|nr:homoserine dehydrogenase [Erysipelotrichaceae bacterium RD49]
MNCVLLGYGTVGRSVEALCQDHPDLNLKHVFVRPSKASEPYFTSRGQDIVSDDQIDLVFECLNGLEPANTLIRTALEHGKHVISSNKAVMSKYLPDYVNLARQHGGSVSIEATVGGGIPILDALLKLSRAEELNGFEGILNGTSNYILTSMESTGASFEEALQAAIEKGYAEADPTNDIEGIDVWYKTLLAASLLTRSPVCSLPNPVGISKISAQDFAFAKANGRKIRHLATIARKEDRHSALIAPVFVKENDFFGSVNENYNAQLVYGKSFGKLGYYGQGAGGLATAQALVADALDVVDGRIRQIRLDQTSALDSSLIVMDWIVRPSALKDPINAFVGFEDAVPFENVEMASQKYGKDEHLESDSKNNSNSMMHLEQKSHTTLGTDLSGPSIQSGYWFIPQKTLDSLEALRDRDPEMMIGVWKNQ